MNKALTVLKAVPALLVLAASASAFAADVGVSVSIGQPGFYGRIDVGRAPSAPVLLYPQPVIIAPAPVAVQRAPIYLRVPPGHASDWRRYCGRYDACGQPVYFVREDWYQDHWRREHEHDHDHDRRDDHGRGHGRGHDKHAKHDH
jgi:hypothetical protein